nr:EF-hand calcium-binding protein [Kwoniella dejecticola CBS 10117]OBR88254.1 EF-hand calcium-binding protein [Kwoniella dejecticola CBS 10117]
MSHYTNNTKAKPRRPPGGSLNPTLTSNSNQIHPHLGSNAGSRGSLTEDQKGEIKEAFELFDLDKDGAIDYHELKVAMRALGFDMKKSEVMKLLKDLGGDDGLMDFSAFERIMTEKILARNPETELRRAFELFDDDRTGRISLKNLKRVARELGENLGEEEL